MNSLETRIAQLEKRMNEADNYNSDLTIKKLINAIVPILKAKDAEDISEALRDRTTYVNLFKFIQNVRVMMDSSEN